MKTSAIQNPKLSGNRRSFLKSAGVLALGAPAVMAETPASMPEPAQWWNGIGRLQLLAEGIIPVEYVLPPLDPVPVFPPGMAARLRATFPLQGTKDVLSIRILVGPAALPLPTPDPPLSMLPTLSYLEAKVTAVELSYKPELNLAMLGRVTLNNPAMLGDMTGAAFVLTTGAVLNEGAPTAFNLLGVHVPGHHTTMTPAGLGTLIIR